MTKTKQMTKTKIQNPKLDEIVKNYFKDWIPAFASMTPI
jgi:hypothetical protein